MTKTSDRAAPEEKEESRGKTLEMVAVIILSITTVLTAWSAFEASKWGGAMSIAFSQASATRIESAGSEATANARSTNQLGLWTQWAGATATGNSQLAAFLSDRFPEPLATAHEDWLAAGGTAAGAPASPFDMPSYVLPEQVEAAALSDRAGQQFQIALRNNQRGDNYTILTVLFATVLFFTALAARVRAVRSQQVLIGTALVFGLVGVVLLVAFPKLV